MTADLLHKIESLHNTLKTMAAKPEHAGEKDGFAYAQNALVALARAVQKKEPVFGVEPWHPLAGHGAHLSPGEYLLRLKDGKGQPIPPYPAVMVFYKHGFTAELDTILFLCGLMQFAQDSERQVSINISARSLHNSGFIKTVLNALEKAGLKQSGAEKIILEIHESTGNLKMSPPVLELFRKFGACFAIDDVGLSMDNVFRLSEFDDMADYVKIDRQSVCAHPGEPHALSQVMSFVRSLLPDSIVIAEGVKTAEHAAQLYQSFPDIQYVQGLYLPPREEFAAQWDALTAARPAKTAP